MQIMIKSETQQEADCMKKKKQKVYLHSCVLRATKLYQDTPKNAYHNVRLKKYKGSSAIWRLGWV
jgi:hypothetical protein